jgi:hypothetical protein
VPHIQNTTIHSLKLSTGQRSAQTQLLQRNPGACQARLATPAKHTRFDLIGEQHPQGPAAPKPHKVREGHSTRKRVHARPKHTWCPSGCKSLPNNTTQQWHTALSSCLGCQNSSTPTRPAHHIFASGNNKTKPHTSTVQQPAPLTFSAASQQPAPLLTQPALPSGPPSELSTPHQNR